LFWDHFETPIAQMALPATVFSLLLVFLIVPQFRASLSQFGTICPTEFYCPAGDDCRNNGSLCELGKCQNNMSTDNCEEGTEIFTHSS